VKYFLGIDCGGTMTKAAIYSAEGREISVEAVETDLIIPAPGFAERDMNVMREAICDAVRRVMSRSGIEASKVAAVACCGHGKGLYLWGHDGNPVRNAILSTDNRAYQYSQRWKDDGIEDKVFSLSLQHIMPCQPVALLSWLKDHEPATLERTQWIFECKDYVRYFLTGEARAELTDYSGANLINLRTQQYDLDLLGLFGLKEIAGKLPPLCKSTDICGFITGEVADKTGLCEGTPVAGGMFDIDACALAVNAASEDRLCVIAGTWSINEYIRTEPVTDKSVALNSIFCDPDYYLIEESSPTSAGNYEWFIRTMLPEFREYVRSGGKSPYDACSELVESIPADEFCPIFLPFLFASNVHPNAKSCFVGLTSYHTRAHLIRSVYEGIVYCHKYHIDKLLRTRKSPPACIQLAGGVARSRVWSQMFADICEMPVETVDVDETGALGCAINAAVAVGQYSSFAEAAKRMVKVKGRFTPDQVSSAGYRKKYSIYLKTIKALDTVWDDIQALV
jgi:L-xylulokinase